MLATENLLQKLEEKMMALLAELERVRQDNQLLSQENTQLKNERENDANSVKGLISLLDSVGSSDGVVHQAHANQPISALAKPMLVQG